MCRLLLLPLHRYHQAKQHLTQDREAASSALGQAGAGSIVNNRIGYHGPLLAHSSRGTTGPASAGSFHGEFPDVVQIPTRRRVDLAGFALISGWIDPRLFDRIVVGPSGRGHLHLTTCRTPPWRNDAPTARDGNQSPNR